MDGNKGKLISALYGRSDFQLKPHMMDMKVDFHQWCTISEKNRDTRFKAMISREPPAVPTTITSKDGSVTIPKTNGTLKKPYENKSVRSSRTKSKRKLSMTQTRRRSQTPNAGSKKAKKGTSKLALVFSGKAGTDILDSD